MPRYVIYLAGFEYMDEVAMAIERMGGAVISYGKISPYLVVELPTGLESMVMGLRGVRGIMPTGRFRTMQINF